MFAIRSEQNLTKRTNTTPEMFNLGADHTQNRRLSAISVSIVLPQRMYTRTGWPRKTGPFLIATIHLGVTSTL